ncbi:MAG: alpha/beta hydrolase [Magnetococcales bacterium]|nr:alpha/beta hydrolase [Magnetococcales bacterium]
MTSAPTLLCVHGWGFGPGFWRPLLRHLPQWPAQTIDLGFFGPEHLDFIGDGPWVALGHSTGFLWLLNHLKEPPLRSRCLGLISLMGFSRFVRGVDFPGGIDRRILLAMKRELANDSHRVLDQFMALGGVNRPMGGVRAQGNAAALAKGLEWLLSWDERPTLAAWNHPWLALAHHDDGIVNPHMTRDCFGHLPAIEAGGLHWMDTEDREGGHFLPLLTDPQPYATIIHTFLSRYFS